MSIKGVPHGVRRRVKEGFVRALRTSPLLANGRAVKTWIVWDGETRFAGEPSTDMMPACQVRILGGPVARKAGARMPGAPMSYSNESHFTAIIDLWTAGPDAGDLSDLADLIYQVLSPQDHSQRAARDLLLREAGIADCQLTREILPASAESFALASISGQGAYELTMFTAS